jgi:hypothetical protein
MPYHIAFDHSSFAQCLFYNCLDFCFFIDLVLMFFTTIPETERLSEVIDRRKIANAYLTGWFIFDLLSILPFDTIFSSFSRGKLTIC